MKAWLLSLIEQPWPTKAMLIEGFKRSVITYSRLPLKHEWQDDTPHVQAVTFLPLVGAIIALISTWPLLFDFSDSLSALLIIISSVVLTGAFHEDGMMDSLDGLIGGWTQEQRLEIMKDSRLGSYAAIGIWCVLSLKWLLLTQILALTQSVLMGVLLWLFIHALARVTPILIMHKLPYVSLGKSKAVSMIGKLSAHEWVYVGAPIALLSSFMFAWHIGTFLCVLVGIIATLFGRYLKHKISGFNGDTLGASEQISELALLFSILIYFS
ncbi:cobalamin biosynthesis protein CobS [Marinomonas sp. SBI22]|uniref:adenosylcobinamide-GDP ribazoletransferase n=1 Tax=unclassified Marinomonas TaxID=196814 RepID=UPI0007AEF9AE|nr:MULTISPECIES: adenosylcobinamide-GDP ribazoletransferase [unclassified Marinomonas]KZM41426.1 cobalamin biosynthesis protein CobS [Marinomonas sp. SBI22]KZM43262.1 cobalamin biosynthesis protein CobS [Marinomonas sp. SBI8L]